MIAASASSFGKYVLIERLASGRSGEVFLARVRGPIGFKKLCVIKRVSRTSDAACSGSFVDEGTITAHLNHPHIVQIYDMGEHDRWMYLTTEYVEGKSLREVLAHAKRGLAPEQVAQIFVQLASALGFAHAQGVVHRDVEPANIIVAYNGEAKLIDFGSAASDGSDRTQLDTVGRRVPYMSPEQNAADEVDARTDVFSLGVCLYEALTGKNPFMRRNPVEALDAVRSFKPPSVSRYDARLKPFDAVVARALAKKRDERFADCQGMADALKAVWRQLGDGEPLSSRMEAWFPDEIHDERYLARVALADADTTAGRRPTNVDKRALSDRGKWIGIAAAAFVATVLVTSLATRAVVRSHTEAADGNVLVAATSDAVKPKLNELVVKPGATAKGATEAAAAGTATGVRGATTAGGATRANGTTAAGGAAGTTGAAAANAAAKGTPSHAATATKPAAPPLDAPPPQREIVRAKSASRSVSKAEAATEPAAKVESAAKAAPAKPNVDAKADKEKTSEVKDSATPSPTSEPPKPSKATAAKKDTQHDWTKDVTPSSIDDDEDEEE